MSEENQTELLEKPAPKTASIEEIAAPLVNSMPDVTQAAEGQTFAPEATPDTSKAPNPPEYVDVRGTVFDANKHAADAEGKPKKSGQGTFYSKSVGRPRKNPVAAAPANNPSQATFADIGGKGGETPQAAAFAPVNVGPDRFEVAADSYLQLSYAVAVMAFSPDVKPDEAEHAALKIPAAQLLRRYDVQDIHPGITFAAVATGIFLRKLEKPTVRERWDALCGKAKTWFSKTFKK